MNIQDVKILDCTIRDGGYYTNWDFDDGLIKDYCLAMESSPIDFVEIGYRSMPLKKYLGQYFYCPSYLMKRLKALMPSKELVVILNEKDIREEHVNNLLKPCIPYISMVRIAIAPKNITRAIKLAIKVKELGFKVAFNVMYMSNWNEIPSFFDSLKDIDGVVEYFYMVDSYGGVMPNEVKRIMDLVKSHTNVPLGFHGHNNLEMAMSNTLAAIDNGCEIIDSTLTGMGRGAGNLRTELLLTYLESKYNMNVDYTTLGVAVEEFENLKQKFKWGSNLPYMFSGAYSLPQSQVMEWVGLNRFPISSILNALNNQKKDIVDNVRLPYLSKEGNYQIALLVGGGASVNTHYIAIKKLIETFDDICVVHAGVRNVNLFMDLKVKQFYVLSGFESVKLLRHVGDYSNVSNTCVFPPYPRRMGTIIPNQLENISKELKTISFTNESFDSPLSMGIQVALEMEVKQLHLVGFDGYNSNISEAQHSLASENQIILDDFTNSEFENTEIFSLTPTKYKNVEVKSIYSLIR